MLNYVDNKLNVLHPATQNYSRLLWSFAFPGFLKIRGSTGTKQACHWVPTGVGEIIFAITWSHVVSAILTGRAATKQACHWGPTGVGETRTLPSTGFCTIPPVSTRAGSKRGLSSKADVQSIH